MKNIPLFTTENGIASLSLQEIPYTQQAYVHIRCAQDLTKLIEDCVSFCKAVGADAVYASGDELADYPIHARILQMRCLKERIPQTDACLFPVTEKTLQQWRSLYNDAMAQVPNAAWMSEKAATDMLAAGQGYFVHRDGVLLGIGKVSGGNVDAVAAVVPGSGETLMRALCGILQEEAVTLEVADTNEKAVRLYTRMGFLPVREVSQWYQVYKK